LVYTSYVETHSPSWLPSGSCSQIADRRFSHQRATCV